MKQTAMHSQNAAFGLVSIALFIIGCHTAPPPTLEKVADSVSGFSDTQGFNGWWYGYWDRSTDSNGHFDQEEDFRLLKHFGSDPINGLSGHTEFTTGKLWYLQDGVYYTSLWASGGHPNSAAKLGAYAPAEHWAVRRWISTTAGTVTISGHAGKVMPWGLNWGGGVKTNIVVDGMTLFSADIENQQEDYSLDATVKPGTLVDFLIGPNPSIGVIEFTGTIRTASAKQK